MSSLTPQTAHKILDSRTLFITYRRCSEMKSGDAQRNVQQNSTDNTNWRDQNQNIDHIYSKNELLPSFYESSTWREKEVIAIYSRLSKDADQWNTHSYFPLDGSWGQEERHFVRQRAQETDQSRAQHVEWQQRQPISDAVPRWPRPQ